MQLVLLDGRAEIDNNLVENAIRPVAIGRKNYLFAGSHEAAKRTAIIYTFFSTCKMANINPEEWIVDVLSRIQDTKIPAIHTLFPQNWRPKAQN
jgi:transposase